MSLSVIVYNINSPYIFVDCDQQESYGQLLYSIQSLRKHSDIPVIVYANSKYPLEEFQYMQKYFINNMFSGVEFFHYEKDKVDQENAIAYCVEETFKIYGIQSMMYINHNSVFNDDPRKLFKDFDISSIYRAREPFTECSTLLLHRDKSDKFLNGSNIGYRTISQEILKVNFNPSLLDHSNLECTISAPIITYNKKQTEYFVPSNYWNCSVSDRIKVKPKIICHSCCKIIADPIVLEDRIEEQEV